MIQKTIVTLIILTMLTACNQVLIKDGSGPTEKSKQSLDQTEGVKVLGSITGEVTLVDETADLSGVAVNVEGLSYGAVSAKDGCFKISHVPAGKYKLVYSKDGYEKVRVEGIYVERGKNTILLAQQLQQKRIKIINSTLRNGSQYNPVSMHYLVFNESLQPTSIDPTNFYIVGGIEKIEIIGFELYDSTLMLKMSNSLEYSTNYTFSFSGLTSYFGSVLTTPEVITFRTHDGPPEITSITPTQESRNFPVDKPISLVFNRTMDSSTLKPYNLTLINRHNFEVTDTNINYDSTNNQVDIIPNQNLIHGTIYELNIYTFSIRDINGVSYLDHREPAKKAAIVNDIRFETVPHDFTPVMGQWTEVKVNSGNGGDTCFSFDGVAGKSYEIAWDDAVDGSGKYTISSNLMWNYGERHSFNSSGGQSFYSGYTAPPKFTITRTGKVYFYMESNSDKTGTIAIKVTELP